MTITATYKIALVLLTFNPDFTEKNAIVREFDNPDECMAMYIDRTAKASHGEVRYSTTLDGQDIRYQCLYVDQATKDIMAPNFLPPGTLTGRTTVVYAPYHPREPDVIIEQR